MNGVFFFVFLWLRLLFLFGDGDHRVADHAFVELVALRVDFHDPVGLAFILHRVHRVHLGGVEAVADIRNDFADPFVF